jgi:hypothetical protein
MIEQIKNYKNFRLLPILTVILLFGMVLIPTIFWHGGILEIEATTFMPQYLDNRTILQKVFDPNSNDWNTFQARELSFFFDYIDANFYYFLLRATNVALYIPFSSFLASFLIIAVWYIGTKKTLPKLPTYISTLILVLLLTSFVFVSTMGLYYRSGKPMLAPIGLALMFYILWVGQKTFTKPAKISSLLLTKDSAVVFLLSLLMGLLDRQGFFYTLVACIVLSIHYFFKRRLQDLLIGSLLAAIFLQLYNSYIGPNIVHIINGYWPDPSYQKISYIELLSQPSLFVKATNLLIDNTIAIFGSFNILFYISVIVVCAFVFYKKGIIQEGKLKTLPYRLGVGYALIIFSLQVLMFALMISKHHYVYDWVDHRFWYYPLSYVTTVIFGLAILVNNILPLINSSSRKLLCMLLIFMSLSNLLNLQHYKDLMLSSYWFLPVYEQAEMLKKSFQTNVVNPELNKEYRSVYFQSLHKFEYNLNSQVNLLAANSEWTFLNTRGLSGPEGKSPNEWRWALGPETSFEFKLPRSQIVELAFSFNNPIKGQDVVVEINQETVLRLNNIESGKSVDKLIKYEGKQGFNKITFRYKDWNHKTSTFVASDERLLSVAFNKLLIQPQK